MKWTVEAKEEYRLLPSFARHRFRKKLELDSREKNKEFIEVKDIREMMGDDEIQELIRLDRWINDLDYSQNIEFNICGGVRGCRFSQADDLELIKIIKRVIDKSEILELIEKNRREGRAGGKRIKLALASCPNSCSQAQIQDIAILVNSRPRIDFSQCVSCGKCLKACPLDIINLDREEFLREECIGCNACLRACPIGAISQGKLAYKILIGGSLGRLPKLAKVHRELETLEEVELELQNVVNQLKSCIEQGLRWRDYSDYI